MKLVGGYPFFLIKDGLPFNYPALERSIKTEVLIIGGGISGALVAYQLINAGVDCVVVDARTIGLGSTCASTSLLQYEIDIPLSVLIEKIGLQQAVSAYKLCEKAIGKLAAIDKKIGCGEFEFKKSLYYAPNQTKYAALRKEFEARKENGFKVRWLEEKDIKKHYGFAAPAAILSDAAAQTDAYKFTHALHQYSIQQGLKVYDRTEVIDIAYQRNSILTTTSNGSKIKAKYIIYANGYEAINYIDKKIVEVQFTYAVASEQYPAGTSFWRDEPLIWNMADPYLYMRTSKDRRIFVGGRDEKFSDECRLEKVIQSKSKQLKKDFEKLFPTIKFKPEFSWAGTFVTTGDGLPFIGSMKDKPNSYFALGFGGNGITFSQVAAEIITDLIIKGGSKYGKLFSFERISSQMK